MKKRKKKENFFLLFLMGVVFLALLGVGYRLSTMNWNQPFFNFFVDEKTPPPSNPALQQLLSQKKGKVNSIIRRIYFPRSDNLGLIAEERSLPDEKLTLSQWAAILIYEILKGPFDNLGKKIIPDNTLLRSSYQVQNTLYLDFNKEFLKAQRVGTREEIFKLYSIVNTITQFEPDTGIVFLVEGQSLLNFGNLNLETPFYFNPSLLIQEN